ncbi:carbonic anhydrase [Micromonospora sp. BQ11]|uniref:carbonic anhydrase n=1 Tax=Micromonospora sp. BQ11 TaxID=3452212 RepID=UPI003F8BCCE6
MHGASQRGRPAADPPTRALALLRAGHRRYRAGDPPTVSTSGGPDTGFVAAVLSCADPQTPAAAVFGGLDLFGVRTAGLRLGPAVLGSLEYAVDHLHVPLVVVLGHTRCRLPGAGGPAHVRAAVAALRHRSRHLDAAVTDGRCAVVGMCWHDGHDQLSRVLSGPVRVRRPAGVRPPSRPLVPSR